MIRQLAAAIGFLTRLPVGGGAFDARDVARSARWFPLVGALLGGIYCAALWALRGILPPMIVAVILVALDAWLTGALHFDGLADTADGFGGGRTREDTLRIMRDHAIGSYGAVALILVIGLKAAAIAALIDQNPGAHRMLYALVLPPVLGRWSAVVAGATQPYARPQGDDDRITAGSPTRFMGTVELIVATVLAGACAVFFQWTGAAACGLVLVATVLWGWHCRRRIGGVTGDTLGAAVEFSECITLLAMVALG